ncbi:unnamed protein product [Rhizophagus irregularis]|nr:unnamed protein product [Rhizophagus irregularis]CAB4441313.1 unnamed protein product [Rhizophagus irregularis]CAB4441325.1 unnamed protein product [Rhizophagus irregularis]CAB4480658.1 unnamed protein product [Rhizophagus irregularis]CAB5391574.1 unnamed protein product [Rhizophagus irregularis]
MTTLNKRLLEMEIQKYSEYISVICAFNKTILELTLESTWSIALEKYIDAVLETAVQVEVSNEISGYIARMSFSIFITL